jgi:hypothetical protein
MPNLNAYYSAPLATFRQTSNEEILGVMAHNGNFSLELSQRNAWEEEIRIIKNQLIEFEGHIFLEFEVPRIGSRIDAVLALDHLLIILEFKVGESIIQRTDLNQAWDYALDLKNFHEGSHLLNILPVLVATDTSPTLPSKLEHHRDGVYRPVSTSADGISGLIQLALTSLKGAHFSAEVWASSIYKPTPTIIEAAQRLFAENSVEAITRNDAGKQNLAVTAKSVEAIVNQAEREKKKAIVFVTGVPGSGKTLVGLTIATNKRDESSTHAVFLSGNGPLVQVLNEALTQDEYNRTKDHKPKPRKGEIRQKVKAFVQNVHHFRDDGIRSAEAPSDHVVIFDEAQRAWNRQMTSNFMKQKKGQKDFDLSEPEFLVSYLDRHKDWAAVICLVGGGQEINRGEAGISAWLDAIREKFKTWDVYLSDSLTDREYAAGHAISHLEGVSKVTFNQDLHLKSSIRSFRSENVSNFVKALLDREVELAKEHFAALKEKFPIRVTRNLGTAKEWIRNKSGGTERCGMVASSGAHRLRPHAIDVRVPINPCHWFLNPSDDIRSSNFLEEAATEFHVQGLELDWVCINWDADLRLVREDWNYHSFRGTRWQNVNKEDGKRYLLNSYRVLLTRARQGMVIFIPKGDQSDRTRLPSYYDATFEYFKELGIPEA